MDGWMDGRTDTYVFIYIIQYITLDVYVDSVKKQPQGLKEDRTLISHCFGEICCADLFGGCCMSMGQNQGTLW